MADYGFVSMFAGLDGATIKDMKVVMYTPDTLDEDTSIEISPFGVSFYNSDVENVEMTLVVDTQVEFTEGAVDYLYIGGCCQALISATLSDSKVTLQSVDGAYIKNVASANIAGLAYTTVTGTDSEVEAVDIKFNEFTLDLSGAAVGFYGVTPVASPTSTFDKTSVTGEVEFSGALTSFAGTGFIFINYCPVTNCYADINLTTPTMTASDTFTGFSYLSILEPTLTNCYAVSRVTGVTNVIGFCYQVVDSFGDLVETPESFVNCFYDSDVSPYGDSYIEGTSTELMQKRDTFESVGWDFGSIWYIQEDEAYPTFLRNTERYVTINNVSDTLVTKTKLRGVGKSLSLEFFSEAGKDLQIQGYALDAIGRSRV